MDMDYIGPELINIFRNTLFPFRGIRNIYCSLNFLTETHYGVVRYAREINFMAVLLKKSFLVLYYTVFTATLLIVIVNQHTFHENDP